MKCPYCDFRENNPIIIFNKPNKFAICGHCKKSYRVVPE